MPSVFCVLDSESFMFQLMQPYHISKVMSKRRLHYIIISDKRRIPCILLKVSLTLNLKVGKFYLVNGDHRLKILDCYLICQTFVAPDILMMLKTCTKH